MAKAKNRNEFWYNANLPLNKKGLNYNAFKKYIISFMLTPTLPIPVSTSIWTFTFVLFIPASLFISFATFKSDNPHS